MISAIVLVKNEEQYITACLDSLSFCYELIVVDNGSTDQTIQLAKNKGAHIVDAPDNHDFSELRNNAMKEATHEWVLFIDADERVDDALKKEIREAIQNNTADTFFLKRRDHWWETEVTHGEVATAAQNGLIRLMKKGTGRWEGAVHERFVPQGSVQSLNGYIEHYPHQSLSAFIQDINHYSSLRARELHKQGVTASGVHIMLYPLGKFFYTYIVKGGIRDGAAGFAYSFLMSFHSFLVRSKLFIMHLQ